jgi:hypothetical protein
VTGADTLPRAFEEPVIAGLEALGQERLWLVKRDHPWRRQLWIKGRNMTAGDLARTVAIEGWSAEEAENRIVAQGYESRRAAVR